MAFNNAAFLWPVLLILAGGQQGHGRLIQHRFEVSYITGQPDGVQHNFILGINGAFPGPQIEAMVNDTLEITLVNKIQYVTGPIQIRNVSLHWHGFHQRGTPFMDGPAFITQCPLKHTSTQKYTFLLDKPGTYWYHSHVLSQYTAGLWGDIIVRNVQEVHSYDGELTLTLNDWYHNSTLQNDAWFFRPVTARSAPPYPDSVLLNGMGRYPCNYANERGRYCNPVFQRRPVFELAAGKKYRLRVINTSGLTAFDFSVDGHRLEVIEVDSLDVKTDSPVLVDVATISAAERYSFILHTNKKVPVGTEFTIRAKNLANPGGAPNINIFSGDRLLDEGKWGVATGVIKYASATASPLVVSKTEGFDYQRTLLNFTQLPADGIIRLNDTLLLPHDGELAPKNIHHSFVFDVLEETVDGVPRLAFNNGSRALGAFILPDKGKPLLFQMLQDNPPNYPPRSNVIELGYMKGVQVIVHNRLAGNHPLHLHGHHFHVLYKGAEGSGFFNPSDEQLAGMSLRTVKRDTVLMNRDSTIILRWVADNPGFFTFHCHIDWHMLSGMVVNFAEAPEEAKKRFAITPDAKRVCKEQGIAI